MNTPPEITDPLLKSLSEDALDLPRLAALEARRARKVRERTPHRSFQPLGALVWLMRFRVAQAAVALLILAAMVKGGSMITGERFPGGAKRKGVDLLSAASVTTKSGSQITLATTGEGLAGESGTADRFHWNKVNLNGANPSLASMTFSSTSSQYTLGSNVTINSLNFTGTDSAATTRDINDGITIDKVVAINGRRLINSGDGTAPGLSGTLASGDSDTFGDYSGESSKVAVTGFSSGTTSVLDSGVAGVTFNSDSHKWDEYDYYPGHPATATVSPVLAQLILSGRNNIVGGNGSLNINAQISGSSGFATTGTGTLALTGANAHTSATAANSGQYKGTRALNSAPNYQNVIKEGTGTEVFTGSNSYSGSTTVSGGTLRVTNGSGLGFGGETFRANENQHTTTVADNNGSSTYAGTITNQLGTTAIAGGSRLQLGNGGTDGFAVTSGTLKYLTASSKNPELSPANYPKIAEYDPKTGKRYPAEFNPPKVPSTEAEPAELGKSRFFLAQNHAWQTAASGPGALMPAPAATPPLVDSRKLIRNAALDFEVASFEKALDTITAVAGEEQGYVFSQNSAKGANGKLQGQIIVKVLPGNLDRFLLKLRLLGDMKNQTVSAQDVSKDYYDTEVRIRNSQVTEARLIEMMKTRTGKVSDLLEVENEISRVRGEIEQMQGQLKVYDAHVQYATVLIGLQEKDLNQTAAYLLQEHAQLSLFAKDVEKAFAEAKSDADAAKAQTLDSHMERDEAGHTVATLHLLIPPGASDEAIAKLKAIGRIEHFNSQTQSVARNGSDNSDTAKVDRDKVELNLVIQRDAENAVQGTNISVLTDQVEEKTAEIKDAAAKAGIEIKGAEFNRLQNGVEISGMLLRMPVRKYAAFIEQIKALGKVKDFTVARREDATATEDAPAEILLQIYSQGYIVAPDTGLWATIRGTIGEGFSALMWSLRMIGVSLAFVIPWALGLGFVVWLVIRRRKARKQS